MSAPPNSAHVLFLKKVHFLMFIVLLGMVAGFFTWSENVLVTRVVKVIGRLGMTLAVIWLHGRIIEYGAVAAFKWKNVMSPLLYFAYLLLGFISFLWSTDVGYSALQWLMDVECLFFSFFFIKCLMLLDTYFPGNKIRFYNLVGNVAFSLLAVFVVGMLLDPDDFFRLVEGGEDKRLGGYIMNPNELGMLCGIGVSCLIFDLYHVRNKVWTILKIFIMAYVLIMTKSRSSLVGLLLVTFFHVRRLNSKALIYSIYLLVAAVIPVALQKLVMRKGGIDDVLSMTGRLPFWKALINEGLPREPLLGFGFMRIDYKDKFESVHTYAGHMTHNTFMQVLMNLGFVGLCVVLLQMAFTLRGFYKEQGGKKLILLGIIIPVLINSFTEFGIFGENNYGILFYQMLIFLISLRPPLRLTPAEQRLLKCKRANSCADYLL